ncbi:acyl-CoA dehydrogenase C-terminal domain-containing protein [Thermomonas sp. HDW16]|uniref:acyl-CoA dehydrogenase C-terminal domain-containing protein n=1 Tax=Thermomonas sp. HDW16 TaxID=2714945 RepID=UPI001408791A|nr:acyl-CoA dehydrogenase C-terminal domain-containing protein [Thermomonas sp. HDW16]QIL20102.1 acyl-CoA dehydrogenase [Thermomonas sp. HDW16]
MSSYKAPLEDIRFALFDVLDSEATFARLGFADANRELVDAVIDEAARFTETVLAPLNKVGDEIGCKFDAATGDVAVPPGFKQAFDQFVEGGWTGLTNQPEHGGQGMPAALGGVLTEMVDSANLAWGNFPMLSHGAVQALETYGEDWQKEVFLKPLVAGTWTGTMCLTEPHCGTDLGLLKTKAIPNDDGSYAITGTKIFITAGEHDMSGNIVHLVLAKLPDAPPGAKGISLFVTPKFKVAQDGTIGERNALRCGSIEHKMGIHGSATCVMNFDGAQGYLVGEPHKGLQAMFVMMNSARLGVGVQGLGLSERAYQNALRYSRERLQSRSLSGPKSPDKPADPIIVQPDVRRMLLSQKALVEGGRLLSLHAYSLLDAAEREADAVAREHAHTLVSFLTPISKACQTEWSIENTYNAIQCFGGHGYIHEHGMEQYARDARITTLYEGTTGIQALDLIGRKTAASQGAGLKLFLAMIEEFAKQHEGDEALAEFIGPLRAKAGEWGKLTLEILQRAASNPEELGAASYDYLFYSGYVVLAYWWARSVAAADASDRSQAFKDAKRETARFYFARLLPRTLSHKAAIDSGAAPLMTMPAELFGD